MLISLLSRKEFVIFMDEGETDRFQTALWSTWNHPAQEYTQKHILLSSFYSSVWLFTLLSYTYDHHATQSMLSVLFTRWHFFVRAHRAPPYSLLTMLTHLNQSEVSSNTSNNFQCVFNWSILFLYLIHTTRISYFLWTYVTKQVRK